MATLDEIRIDVKGNMDDINKKLDKLERQINKTTSASSSRFKSFANIAKATIGAVFVQQVASAGIRLAQFSGDIDELKSKSSAVFKEFTSDVRGELAAFGDAVGRSTAELEGMASGVQDTFVPLGFARGEAAKLSTNLTKLAVDVASFNNASDTETMDLFKSALVGNHEAVRRFGIVITETELKQELLRMGIKKNANQVDAQTKVQARLNLIMAGTADAQGDASRTAGSFANRQRALRAELSEVGDELGLTLQPALAGTVNFLIEATKSTREFLTVLGILTPRIDSLASANERIGELEAQITKMGGKTGFFGFGGMKVGDLIDTTEFMTPGVRKEIERLQTELQVVRILRRNMIAQKSKIKIEREATRQTEKLAQTNREFSDILGDVQAENAKVVALISARTDRERELIEMRASTLKNDLSLTKEQRAELELLLKTLQANQTILNNRNEELDRANSLVQSSITDAQQLKDDIMALDFALQEDAITQEQYARAVAKVKKEYKELTEVIPEMSALNQIFLDTTVQVANGLENAFIDALNGSKSALESMRDISTQLIEEILRQFMRLTVINPIIQGIFGSVPGFQASAFPMASPSQIFSGAKKTFFGAAGGGTIQGRRPVMVGERGPEMFIPNTGGRIVPNGALGGSLTGGSPTVVNQSLNFATGVQETVRAEIFNMLPAIQKATLNAVVDQKRRGGAFAQGMT